MRYSVLRFAVSLFVVLALMTSLQADPLGSEFTYQGQLKQAGCALNGTADLRFTLHDAAENGSQVGSEVVVSDIAVVDGLFTVQLDFGVEVFNGEARWLEVDARIPHDPTDTLPFSPLSPRQALTATPYSLQTRGVYVDPLGKVGIGTTSPNAELEVAGTVHSTSGGFKFPDGTLQTTAALGGGSLWTQTGNDIFYTAGSVGIGTSGPVLPLSIVPLRNARLPSRRIHAACAADPFTGKIYCFGGTDDTVGRLTQILEYDPTDDTVTVKSAVLPSPRYLMACAANPFTGKIYCLGGDGPSGWSDQILEYDPTSDTLTVKSAVLPSPRYAMGCAADPSTGKIYCLGGYGGQTGRLDQIVEYDPASDAVSVKSALLPTARFALTCSADPNTGKIYCFGGQEDVSFIDHIVEYDPNSDAVTIKSASLPSPRRDLASCHRSLKTVQELSLENRPF